MKRKMNWAAMAALLILLSGISCKKSAQSQCGGGISLANNYMFWIKADFGCGPITVTMKDDQGEDFNTPYRKTVEESAAPQCSDAAYQTHATFFLAMGRSYTYRASYDSRQWTGTINVPCEEGQCHTIELE